MFPRPSLVSIALVLVTLGALVSRPVLASVPSSEAVMYMLDHYDLIDTFSADGGTPLTYAIGSDTTVFVVGELLLRGADPCKRNKANESVEDILAKLNQGKKVYDEHFAFIRQRLICQKK